jgi:hypothetical protein
MKKIAILTRKGGVHVWQRVSIHTKMQFVWGATYKSVPFPPTGKRPNASNTLESLEF